MLRNKITLLLIIVLKAHLGLFAQIKGVSIEAEQHIGWLIPEYSFVNLYSTSNIHSTAINIKQQSYGANDFEAGFNFPQRGIRFQFSQLGNNEIFGNSLTANYFFEVPIIRSNNFALDNRTGIGIGYITKKHSFDSNSHNIAVGSHFNIYFHTQFGVSYQLKQWQLSSGIYFDHYSNANAAEPNIGLNSTGLYAAVSRKLTSTPSFTDTASRYYNPHLFHQVYLGIGAKHTRAFFDNYFFTSSLSYNFGYASRKWFAFTFGPDLFFDSSVKAHLEQDDQPFRSSDRFQTGIHLGLNFIYRNYFFGIEVGHYLGLKNKINGSTLYSRGMIGHKLSSNLSLRLSMKSHLHILDYPELALGWTF